MEALCGTAVHLQTLDGRPLAVPINAPISLQQVGAASVNTCLGHALAANEGVGILVCWPAVVGGFEQIDQPARFSS